MLSIKVGDVLLDTDKSTAIGFKFTSGWVDGIQANGKYRTFDFSVPATAANNRTFEHTNNPSMYGLRSRMNAVIGDGGVWMDGTLYLRSCNKERYNLLFIHGRENWDVGGVPSGIFPDSIQVTDKYQMVRGGTIPNFDFYSYQNLQGDTYTMNLPMDHMPCMNFGYFIDTVASYHGYTVNYPAVSGWLNAWSYGLLIPTANVYNTDTVTATGSGVSGWSVTVGSGGTLASAGLQIVTRRYKRGNTFSNVTVHTFEALRPIRIRTSGSNLIFYASGTGYTIKNGQIPNAAHSAVEFDMNTGDWFTLVSYYDLNRNLFGAWRWYGPNATPAGYTTSVTETFTVMENSGTAGSGSTLELGDNLPDLTLSEALAAFCDIICGTYTVNTDLGTIDIITLDGAMAAMPVGIDLNNERVISIGDVKPYIEGWAQHNYVRCDSADYVDGDDRFVRDYPCNNDYLDREAELGTIPFNEGCWIYGDLNGTQYKTVYLEDIEQGDNGEMNYHEELTIICEAPAGLPALHLNTTTDDGVGLDYANFTRDALTLEVSVALPLYKFLQLYTGTLIHFGSRDWVIRSANWSGGVVNMTLLSYSKPQPVYPDALNFVMPNGGDITLTKHGSPTAVTLEYSTDNGDTWQTWSEDGNGNRSLTLAAGEMVFIRNASDTSTGFSTTSSNYYQFSFTNVTYAGGPVDSLLCKNPSAATLSERCYYYLFRNCTTLLTAPKLPSTTLNVYCYGNMFSRCTSLTTAPVLPATTLANYCYSNMFNGCTSLTTAPALPATTLTNYCYSNMFRGCTALTIAPALPATTLTSGCYSAMFINCTALTTPPALPATTLVSNCYHSMFSSCTSLTTAPALPAATLTNSCYLAMFADCSNLTSVTTYMTDVSATDCLTNWLRDVSASGILYCPAATAALLPSGASGIPTGWTQVDI